MLLSSCNLLPQISYSYCLSLAFFILVFFSLSSSTTLAAANPSFIIGISPQDEKYFDSELIPCRDGSKSFSRDRLNDGFCDCVDGTDEPGTSACPESKFYCRNVGSTPQLLFSSRVNDQICDCCDGSDEYDGNINCQNRCIKTENVLQKKDENTLTKTSSYVVNVHERNSKNNLEDLIQKLKEFKILLIVEVVLVGFIMTFGIFRRRIRFRRRRY
ncbi:hypothetical protein MRB53_015541 [Persea americana]|uniref:Uncharacterized protein n=1 Tax=Persea americana TaxID=3435 RepID=A0ACC2LZF0_PERAE|nr:hypothetical protein MRB53_015541 [Persea americana]